MKALGICQVRSAGGHAVMAHGNSKLCVERCKIGGTGSRVDAQVRGERRAGQRRA